MLSIENFWDHITEIERGLEKNMNFPSYNIIRHDEENATIEFALAGYKKNDLSITVIPTSDYSLELLLIVNLRKSRCSSIEESLAESSARDFLSPRIGTSREHIVKTEFFL